jgi:hypothetical protein
MDTFVTEAEHYTKSARKERDSILERDQNDVCLKAALLDIITALENITTHLNTLKKR